ncbi:MAG: T9SS type A sorting domain-containing protein [Lewinellaceae bacterium]|nr:T9SS type A sorting domain-containing protein [Lewinellaceae bacterium]
MITLQQITFRLSGLSARAVALLLPVLLLGTVSPAAAGAPALPTLEPGFLVDTTNLEAEICTGTAYMFGDVLLTESGIYTETYTAVDGSDSTVVLTLTVLPAPVTAWSVTLCEGASYDFFGDVLTASGEYEHTLSTPDGCDSIISLSLDFVPFFDLEQAQTICHGDTIFFGNAALTESGTYVDSLLASGGCDSVVTLVLTVLPRAETTLNAGVCEGFTYVFQNDTLDQSGTYVQVLPAVNGCDSTVTLHLVVAAFFETEQAATICAGESYTFAGQDLTESGVYTDPLTAAGGCDSTLILTLTVLDPIPTTQLEITICSNEAYSLGNEQFQDPGNYTVTLSSVNGCDSLVELTLNVLPISGTNLEATICANESIEVAGALINTPGDYQFVLTAENGCDSLVNLALTVLDAPEIELEVTLCNGETYDFAGETLSQSGTYPAVLTTENGCDSTVTLVLEILPVLETNLEIQICAGDSYELDGNLLTDPGNYTAILIGETGCDSTVNLTLSVAPVYETVIDATICVGESYPFNGIILTESGTYAAMLTSELGCDSTITLNLTVLDSIPATEVAETICAGEIFLFDGVELFVSGQYEANLQSINGCDSLVFLTLEVLPVASTQLEATICAGATYIFEGTELTDPGTYSEMLIAENGCDSMIILDLTVLPVFETMLSVAVCANASYEFDGQQLDAPGTYTAVFDAENGCDSTVVLTLEHLPLAEAEVAATICSNEIYVFDGLNLNAAGVYKAVFIAENGCDSTVTLSLEVLDAPVTEQEATICSNEQYDFYGEILNASGIYTQAFTAENGCDSSIVLNLIVLPVADITVNAQICEGNSYAFDGQDLNTSGTYQARFTSVDGCDSLVTLELQVLDTLITALQASICAGESYSFAGDALTAAGEYAVIYQSNGGCDSLIMLTLSVLPVSTAALEASICQGETYLFNGTELTDAGEYTAVLTNAAGCDSTVTLNLAVLPVSETALEASICQGEIYLFNGDELTEPGAYLATLTNVAGCDSILALTLTVLPVSETALEASICQGEMYLFNGDELTDAGAYTAVLTNAVGCDSTVTLVLSVLPVSTSAVEVAICAGTTYQFDGVDLTEPGAYTAVFTGVNGCDSTVVLNLAVLPIFETQLDAAICPGDTYEFNGEILDAPGSYTAMLISSNGCDSLVALELSFLPNLTTELEAHICPGESYEIAGLTFNTPGTYTILLTSINGCDSMVVLTLAVNLVNTAVSLQGNTLMALADDVFYQWIDCATNEAIGGATESSFTPAMSGSYAVIITDGIGCSKTSECVDVDIVSTTEPLAGIQWQLTPNPARALSQVLLAEPARQDLLVELYDQMGRLVSRERMPAGQDRVSLDLNGYADGLFLVRLTDGRYATGSKRLIKVTK